MSVTEGISFFEDQDNIVRQLNILEQMGMGYLTLGQPSWFLSGGEIIGKGTPEELRDNQNSRTGG